MEIPAFDQVLASSSGSCAANQGGDAEVHFYPITAMLGEMRRAKRKETEENYCSRTWKQVSP